MPRQQREEDGHDALRHWPWSGDGDDAQRGDIEWSLSSSSRGRCNKWCCYCLHPEGLSRRDGHRCINSDEQSLLLYIGVQLVEGNVTTPLIQQQTIDLPPALTIVMQFLLGVLFGLMGLALAVPVTAVGITLVQTLYVKGYLERRSVLAS